MPIDAVPASQTLAAGRGRRPRILVVDYTSALWGAERVTLELAIHLAKRGIDMQLACPARGDFPATWQAVPLPHVPLDVPAHRGIRGADGGRPARQMLREALVVTRSSLALARLARDVDADVLYSIHQWSHVEVALAGKLARRPVVLHVHNIQTPGLGRRLLAGAARLSSVTLAACQAIADSLGDPTPLRVRVLYPALDLTHFRPGPPDSDIRKALGATPGACLVGIVGRLDPVKGIDVLIRAMARLQGEAARSHLAVVGATYEAASTYVRELKALGERELGDRIRFVDFQEDVPAVLRSLDVLVNASHIEPFGTIVLEAQACGTAVIATTAGGVGEHVEDGKTGLMVPANDADALAQALHLLISDADKRTQMGMEARRMVEERFDVEAAADDLVGIYREIAAER